MAVKAIVTGAQGFVGKHLVGQLLHRSYSVVGLGLRSPGVSQGEFAIQWYMGDIRDPALSINVMAGTKPDVVFHLAGRPNSIPLADLFSTNVQGTLNLLEAQRKHAPDAVFVFASSGAVYGAVPSEQQPIVENAPLNPITPYGVSKMAADLLCYHYAAVYGQRVIRVRSFNLIGPGQSDRFVCAAFARQLAEIKFGLRDNVLQVGNLHSSRDFLDVRDAVRGFLLLAEYGKPGKAYNLCSGRATVIGDMLNQLIGISGLDVDIRVNPARLQQADVPAQIGSYAKAQREAGWGPEITLEQTLGDVWNDWCARTQGKVGAEGELA